MELIVGIVYRSPVHGRYIQVLDIENETSESLTLSILWIDRDLFNSEHGDLTVLKSDVERWTKVEL